MEKYSRLYIASFQDEMIAICDNKEDVQEYCKYNRKLKKDQYDIDYFENVTEMQLFEFSYEAEYLTRVHGMIASNQDWYIMMEDFNSYVDDLLTTKNTLEDSLYFMKKFLHKDQVDSMRDTLDSIESIIRKLGKPGDESRAEVEREYYKRHELMTMNASVYLKYMDNIWFLDLYDIRERMTGIGRMIKHTNNELQVDYSVLHIPS